MARSLLVRLVIPLDKELLFSNSFGRISGLTFMGSKRVTPVSVSVVRG